MSKRDSFLQVSERLFSFRVQRGAYKLAGKALEGKAFVLGRAFACANLSADGKIPMVVVNSDGSVTCDCRDVAGEAALGNLLSGASFESVWHGDRASDLTHLLGQGRIPLPRCVMCPSFRWTPTPHVPDAAPRPRAIHALFIENTVLCNYSCRGCMREVIVPSRMQTSLSLRDFDLILDKLAGYAVDVIVLHNLGEPCLSKHFPQQLAMVRSRFPSTTIALSTNGSLLGNPELRAALVQYADDIEISIDGTSQEVAERYQVGIDFEQVLTNVRALVETRGASRKPSIDWKYILFWWNESFAQLDKLLVMAGAAGVDRIRLFPARTPFYAVPLRFHSQRNRYLERYSIEPLFGGMLSLSRRA